MNVILICGLLAAIYLAINLGLPRVALDTMLKTYLIQPVLWSGLIAAVFFLPGNNPLSKISKRNTLVYLALGLAAIQILFYFIGGLFSGFGRNPAALTPLGISRNIFFVGAMMVGMELARAWLVTRFGKKHGFTAIILTAVSFTFISIPLAQVTGFKLEIGSANQVISSWMPLLAENLAASLLVLLAGARASLAYRGLLAAFWWLCPILPNLDWAFKGLIGAAVPILGMVVINSYFSSAAARLRTRKKIRSASLPAGWITTAVFCVIIIWFATGVFPIKPSLVPTGSMVPLINPGDVVLTAPVNTNTIKRGDIIEFRDLKQNINIIHRVIEIEGEGQNRYFITQGDANSSPDADPVSSQAVLGKTVFTIPKIGWISIVVKSMFTATSEVVQ